jgi:multidrug efflux pump subunit AcrA (membrane-fusion protein)
MMRIVKVIIVFSLIGLIVFLSVGCKSNSSTTTATQQVTVQKGNIEVSVTGTGNLAMSNTKDLSFAMAGTVENVSVNVGDTVTQGQLLATLDTTDRDDQVKTLQQSLANAQRNVTNMQSNVAKAQKAITTAEKNVADKQAAITQAQLDVQTAEDSFSQIKDIQTAQDKVTADQNNVDNAQMNLNAAIAVSGNLDAVDYWRQMVKYYQTVMAADNADLKDILSGSSVKLANNINLQIQQLQLNVQQKKKALADVLNAVDDAKAAIYDANTALANAKLDEADAAQNVTDIQANITDIQDQDPNIVAPFDGIVTVVKAVGGAQIQKGTVAMTVADPTQFKVDFYVTETDIMSVKIGGASSVAVDALSGLSYPAKVTAIAPLANIQQGVVNYKVTAQLTSLKPTVAGFNQGDSSTGSFGNLPSGSITPGANFTPPADFTPGANFTPPANFTPGAVPTDLPFSTNATGSPGAFSRPAAAIQNVTLKDGLSATVTVIIQQAANVLVVPSRAITRVAGKGSTVQLVKNNTTVEQAVTVGLSDSTNTEITQGLNEGDMVMVKATSSSSNNRMVFPGGGGAVEVFRGGP